MWLIGMMGSGKSTIGAIAAASLDVDFYDTDQMVARSAGTPITAIWEESGEPGFRELEREAVAAVPAQGSLAAAGGGAVLDPRNRVVIARSSPVVWLRASPSTLARRVAGGVDRPLLDSPDRVQARLNEILSHRTALYEELATHQIETEDRTIEAVAEEVVILWPG